MSLQPSVLFLVAPMSVIASLLPDVRAQFWRLPAFARFLVLGGISAGVNLVARVLLQPTFSFGFAVVVAYVIGMVVAYNLFRLFVFGATGRSVASEASRFTLVNMVALALVWVISMTLARVVFPFLDFTWHADDVAHVIGVASPAVTSWVGHRRYTFRPH